jgi:phosphatidylethanolamine/phosphatidyl-N-methylethanolamine N-methyltransferase
MPFNTNAWNRARYTFWSPFYDRIASFGKQRRRSIALLDLKPGESVLLSGAGTGADLEYLPRGVHITAVDITPAMIERTANRAQRLGVAVIAEVADAQQLPYADNSFDAVVLHLIVAVAPDGGRVLSEAARVLRPGGKAVVFDKFVADGAAPTVARRLLNVITSTLFSDVTRQLGPMVHMAGLHEVRREPAGLGGRFEIALLTKP